MTREYVKRPHDTWTEGNQTMTRDGMVIRGAGTAPGDERDQYKCATSTGTGGAGLPVVDYTDDLPDPSQRAVLAFLSGLFIGAGVVLLYMVHHLTTVHP